MRLLVATTNPNKLREIRGILAGIDVERGGPRRVPAGRRARGDRGDLRRERAAEGRLLLDALGVTAVAEDSGLEIDALGGEPGVHSARYGGPAAATYPQKFALVYAGLRARGAMGSPARFVCALAVAERAGHPVRGARHDRRRVSDAPRGDGGFGYDPIFFYPPLGRTLAELDEREKAVGQPPRPGVPAAPRLPGDAPAWFRRMKPAGSAPPPTGRPPRSASTSGSTWHACSRRGPRRRRPAGAARSRSTARAPSRTARCTSATSCASRRAAGRRQQVVVQALAEQHLPKAEARLLYEDMTPPPTPEELAVRELERHFWKARAQPAPGAPDRRERRRIRREKEGPE